MTATLSRIGDYPRDDPKDKPDSKMRPPRWLPERGLSPPVQQRLAKLGITLAFSGVDPGYVEPNYPDNYYVRPAPDGSFPHPTIVRNPDGVAIIAAHWGDMADRITIVQV